MGKRIVSKRRSATGSSYGSSLIEGLESRRLFSVGVTPPLVQLHPVAPAKILAGNKPGTEVVTVHNYTTAAVTEEITVSVAPSLDGVNAAGSYGSAAVDETVTIKKHGALNIKVPFVPPTTLAAGKYHTLVTADVGGTAFTGTAPGVYVLTLPPEPTTTPSLIGHYSGLITSTNTQSTGLFGTGTNTTIHVLSFIWETNAQDDSSLSGLFAGGSGQTTGTMQGYELTNGVIHYTLTSDNINYTIDGKVTANGTKITGKIKATLVDNLFKGIGGNFHLALVTD